MGFLLLAALWVWGLVPTFHWLDTGELSLAAASLGIGHPPGQVPHVQLGLLAQLAPFGDLSFRVGLFSLVAGLVTFQVVTKLQGQRAAAHVWTLVFFALATAVSMQALRAEVYSAATLGVLSSIYLGETSDSDRRRLAAAAFVWGMSAAIHPLIALCALPSLLRRGIVRFLPLGLLPVLCLIYLPVRAKEGAQWNFGNPSNIMMFLSFIQGKLYKAYQDPQTSTTLSHITAIAQLLWKDLLGVGLVFAILGIGVSWKKFRTWTIRLLFGLGLSLLPLAVMGNFWPDNPDAKGYLGPFFWLLAATSGLGIHWALTRSRPLLRNGMRVCLALTLFCQVVLYVVGGRLTHDWSAHRQARFLLEEPPPGAEVQVASFQTLGLMRTLQVMEGLRPDLDLEYRGLLPSQMPRVSTSGSSQGLDREKLWELAIYRDGTGRYRLRDEDISRLALLRSEGWFCKFGGNDDQNWLRQNARANSENT